MLIMSEAIIDKPILSLRTGGEMATSVACLINPNNLKIEALYCIDRFDKTTKLLLSSDIREIIKQGIVVNDHDNLSDPNDLIRLKKIIKINYTLIDKPVFTESKKKIGKVADFALDNQTMYIQKLYSSPTLMKTLTGKQLSIDRARIIEITSRKIVIKDIEGTVKSSFLAAAGA